MIYPVDRAIQRLNNRGQKAKRRKFGESFSQSVAQNGRQQSENKLPLGCPYSFGGVYKSNSYGDIIHKFCRENVFKLTSSFSSWPSEAYQVCMMKFIALRFFLLNWKVNPKVWVRVYTKKWRLNFEIDFQNSIDLFVWPVNKLRKKKIKLSFVYTSNSPIHRGKKWNKYWRVTSKKKRKFMSWNQNLSTETEGWRLISLLPKAMRAYRFIIIRPFRPGCHCSEQPYSTLRSNITFARSAEIPHDHISNSLHGSCFPWICSNPIKLLPFCR